MISVFQTYHNEETKSVSDASFYPCRIEAQDQLREHKILRAIYDMNLKKGVTYLGVTDHKFNSETNISGEEILLRIKKDIACGCEKDVYLYPPSQDIFLYRDPENEPELKGKLPTENPWKLLSAENKYAAVQLNAKVVQPAYDLFNSDWQYCRNNYWIAKKEVFDDYCRNWLVPAMDFFHREKITYSYSTLELLFGSFLAHSNYSFDYLIKVRLAGMKKMQWVKVEQDKNKNQFKIAS